MIKSSKVSIKFANKNKRLILQHFIEEYKIVVSRFIDLLWEQDKVLTLLPKDSTSQINTWLSARAIQCAGKQASGIIIGVKRKQEKRYFVYNKLLKEKKYKRARKLKKIIDKNIYTKPNLSNLDPELDQRFIKQDWNNHTSFDGIITLGSLGNKIRLFIPVKKTKHFNKMFSKGALLKGVRLSRKFLTFNFEIEEPIKKHSGEILGLDIGVKNVFTLSNGQSLSKNIHGYDLDIINKVLSRKRKGSRAFEKAQNHRTNYINWPINQINLSNIKILKVENIRYLRKGSRTSRYLSHFTYTEIFNKLESLSLDAGVQIERVNPTYTSQRCSRCGWVRSKNRKGKEFRCTKCGYHLDADLNASRNILAILEPIGKQERLLRKNKIGFYWNEVGKESIVPSTQKLNME